MMIGTAGREVGLRGLRCSQKFTRLTIARAFRRERRNTFRVVGDRSQSPARHASSRFVICAIAPGRSRLTRPPKQLLRPQVSGRRLTVAFATCPVVLFPAFAPVEIGMLWRKLNAGAIEAGYYVSESQAPAKRISDGGTTAAQGFPTIDVFEREILRAVERHAAA